MTWNPSLIREIELPTAALAIDASRDGETLYAACHDGGIYRVRTETGELTRIGGHSSYASGVVLVETGGSPCVVSAGYDGRLRWLDPDGAGERRVVDAHSFWSWQLAKSADGARVASATGQYLCGGYRYEPRAANEPTVKVYEAESGELIGAFEMLPPVQSVAFDSSGRHLAAGNLMGDVRVWDVDQGIEVAAWNTPDFTGWGIIKGHYYTGGIFSIDFSPSGAELLIAGMGSTTDPAAGNGRQLWHRYAWTESPVRKVDETRDGESGQGLMETIRFHPSGERFVMAGRIQKGQWNAAFFDAKTGALEGSFATKTRVTEAVFRGDGRRLYLGGAVSQDGRQKDGGYRQYGRIGVYALPGPSRTY